ncbi:hypothetical protein KC340_g9 [Hortaea werneckii]|nr:hypothetical protein KC340_g9 [Hortaea werneckii]
MAAANNFLIQDPIMLLTVPARPTIPSSKLMAPRPELGTVQQCHFLSILAIFALLRRHLEAVQRIHACNHPRSTVELPHADAVEVCHGIEGHVEGTGSMPFASAATAAALKCSTNLPRRMAFLTLPKFFLTPSKRATVEAGELGFVATD